MNKSLSVDYRAISTLLPYKGNARTHSSEQIDAICLSLKEFGWTNPVLVDGKNGIIAGHGRILAAEQRRAYIIADNQLALRAGWDMSLLRLELTELQGAGFDLAPLGFDAAELAGILDKRPKHPTQKPVELMNWILEDLCQKAHTVLDLFCGSGTTIIAAERANRICCAVEISPAYIDVAIQRWQNFTGQQATLDGKPYDQVKAERLEAKAA